MPVFEFVNPDDPAARTKAKSHVARKAHREKRLREIESYQSQAQPVPKPLPNPKYASTSTPDVPKSERPSRQQREQVSTLPLYAESRTPSTSSGSEAGSDVDTIATENLDGDIIPAETLDTLAENPSSLINTYAARFGGRPQNSFWTVYSQLDAGDRNLLQWYLISVPELTFDIAHTEPLNPMRDWVFPLVGDSSAILHSSLLIGAVNNPSYSKGEKGASRICVQKGRTINLINQGLQKGQAALKDDILYAVAAIAVSEDRLGNHDACQTHLEGLKHMIRLRNGIRSLRKNRALCAALVWAEVSVSNHAAPVAHWPNFRETPHGAKPSELLALEARYEDEVFCRFLTRLQRVQLSKRCSHVSVGQDALGNTEFLFRRGSPLLKMLGEWDEESGIITPVSRMNAYNCQIACLFYINVMLCESHGSPQLTVAFLSRLSSLVRQHSRLRVPRASLFVWIFLQEIENHGSGTDEIDRIDWLIRMIRVARRLSQESIQMLHEALLESLKTYEPVEVGMRVSNDLGILAARIKMGSF